MVYSAALFPDGWIVFSQTDASLSVTSTLFVVGEDGFSPRKLISLPGACFPRISPNGQCILLDRVINGANEVIDEIAPDGTNFKEILKLGFNKCCYTWGPEGKYFLYSSKRQRTWDIWALPSRIGLFSRSQKPMQLTSGPLDFKRAWMLSPTASNLLLEGQTLRAELVYYDMKSHQFLPFLSGIPATEPTFSSDGKWVVYRLFLDVTAWRSHSDGSDRLQLTSPEMNAVWPYVSPDATKVAFSSGGHIFLMDMNGSKPEKIVDKGGSSLWSPDCTRLVFDSDDGMQIYDLRTKKVSALPGGEKKWGGGAWVSDDIVFGATNTANGQAVYQTFNFKTQKWTDFFHRLC